MRSPTGDVLLAGATAALGRRIARALRNRGGAARAIIRHGTAPERTAPHLWLLRASPW